MPRYLCVVVMIWIMLRYLFFHPARIIADFWVSMVLCRNKFHNIYCMRNCKIMRYKFATMVFMTALFSVTLFCPQQPVALPDFFFREYREKTHSLNLYWSRGNRPPSFTTQNCLQYHAAAAALLVYNEQSCFFASFSWICRDKRYPLQVSGGVSTRHTFWRKGK